MKPIGTPSFSTARQATRPAVRAARAALLALALVVATATSSPTADAAQRRSAWAITGATIITAPGNSIENGTLVLRDGLIEAVGAGVSAPADARLIDASGMTVYAGWIDAFSGVAVQADEAAGGAAAGRGAATGRGGGAQTLQMLELGAPGVNAQVHPEFDQADNLDGEDAQISDFRNAGFTAALVVPQEGIYRGQSVLLAMRQADPEELVLRDGVTQTVGFATGGFGRGYPSSSMGVIALIRQVLLDTQRQATWENSYNNDPSGIPRPEANPAYTALMAALAGEQAVIFDAPNTRTAKRALLISQEFALAPIIKGNGNEYEMVDLLVEAQASVIAPVNYPDKPAAGDNADADLDISLADLQRWEQAPRNAAALQAAGVRFAFTADGIRPSEFVGNVRRAIEAGLSEEAALAAVTTNPAAMFGVDGIVGTIEPGKIANVVVATGAPFAEGNQIRHVFVDGIHSDVAASAAPARSAQDSGPADPRGTWAVTMGNGDFSLDTTWSIFGEPGSFDGSVDGEPFDRVDFSGDQLTVTMTSPMGQFTVAVTVSGDRLSGSFDAQGFSMSVDGRRTARPGIAEAHQAMTEPGGEQ